MKKLVLFGLVFLTSPFCFSQTILDAIIQGTILNTKYKFIELKYLNNPLDDTLSSIKIDLNKKGQFYYALTIKRPLSMTICYNNQNAPLYIEPEQSIEITSTAKDFVRNIKYVEKNFNNQYLVLYQQQYENQKNIDDRNKHLAEDEAPEYARYENIIANEKLLAIDKFHLANKLSSPFIYRQKAAIKYGAANNKFNYAKNSLALSNEKKEIPENYYDFMLQLSVTENDLITVPEFYEYLEHHFEHKISMTTNAPTSDNEVVNFMFSTAMGLFTDRIQNIFLTKKFGELLDTYPFEHTSKYISAYMSTVYPTEYRIYIDKKIMAAKARN